MTSHIFQTAGVSSQILTVGVTIHIILTVGVTRHTIQTAGVYSQIFNGRCDQPHYFNGQ